MKTLRLYGLTYGWGSYAQVLRGFELGLESYPEIKRATFSLDEAEDDDPELRTPLADADVGIYLGPPIACRWLSTNARHPMRAVMVAPNSSYIPPDTLAAVKREATLVLVPSGWAAEVLFKLVDAPVLVVPHGVHHEFRPHDTQGQVSLESRYERGEFRILHLSSSGGERKGTVELCRAFRTAKARKLLPPESELTLVLVPEARSSVVEWLQTDDEGAHAYQGIRILTRLGFRQEGASPAELSRIYSGFHLVCQPSRGEAFGMVPNEALASGTPVAATTVTGHSQWARDKTGFSGLVVVPTHGSGPIDDGPGATAPALDIEELARVLGGAYRSWHALKAGALAHAPQVSARWSWSNQIRPLLEYLEQR